MDCSNIYVIDIQLDETFGRLGLRFAESRTNNTVILYTGKRYEEFYKSGGRFFRFGERRSPSDGLPT